MRRPACAITCAYMLGMIIEYMYMPKNIVIASMVCILFLVVLFLKNKIGVVLILIALLGFLNFKIEYEVKDPYIDFYNHSIKAYGEIIDVSYKEGVQMILKVHKIVMNQHAYKSEGKILIKDTKAHKNYDNKIGKKVCIEQKLIPPSPRRNPKMFDYKVYLKSKGIYGLFYQSLEGIDFNDVDESIDITVYPNKIRNHLSRFVQNVLPNKESHIFLSIMLGQKDGLDDQVYNDFKNAGMAHVMAVSGLHIGVLAYFLNYIFRGFSYNIRVLCVLMILYVYMIITGCSASVVRATFMMSILFIAPCVNRKYDGLSALCFTALIILMIQPLNILDIGFLLSFTATLFIILFYPTIHKVLEKKFPYFSNVISLSIAAQIGVLPILMYNFYEISLLAMVWNIPLLLLAGWMVPIGSLFILVGMINIKFAYLLGGWIKIYINVLMYLSHTIANMPLSHIKTPSLSLSMIILYYTGILLLRKQDPNIGEIHHKKGRKMWLIFGIIIMFFNILPQNLKIVFVDVGQGDCIWIQTPFRKNVLIDGGGSLDPRKDVGESVLVPFLKRNGVHKVDLMILSHIHKDHIQGLISVARHIKVDHFIFGTDHYPSEDFNTLIKACKDKKIPIHVQKRGDSIKIEDIVLNILHPSSTLITGSKDDVNNNSLVVNLSYKGRNILFVGDIHKEGEEEILRYCKNIKVDVLKVGHHGSITSSTKDFIQGTKPKVAVIQVGKNSFGHPSERVIKRIESITHNIYRNDENGAVMVYIDSENIYVHPMIE